MAWDDFDVHGHKGFTGDKPIDEFALAMKRVVAAYKDRFKREPTLPEVVYAFEKSLRSAAIAGHTFGDLLRAITPTAPPLDLTIYEGAYQEEPGFHLIAIKSKTPATEVIRVPKLEVIGRTLHCEYEIKLNTLDDAQARLVITQVLLADFCDGYYSEKADAIEFRNQATGTSMKSKMA